MVFPQELVLQYNLASLQSESLVSAHFVVVYMSFVPAHFSVAYRSLYRTKQVLFLVCFRAALHGKNILFSSSHS